MKRWLKFGLIGIGVILIVAVGISTWLLSKALPIGAGFTAKYLCSSTFISQRNPEIVFQEDVAPINPLFENVDWRVNGEKNLSVQTISACSPPWRYFVKAAGARWFWGLPPIKCAGKHFFNLAPNMDDDLRVAKIYPGPGAAMGRLTRCL